MDEIDRIVEKICRSVGGPRSLRQHLREELRAHLEEAVEEHVGEGLSPEEALKMAMDEFGQPESVERDLEGVHGRSVLGFVAAKAMEWKERNLKSGWKWSFAVMSALVLLIAAQIVCIVLPFIFIFPFMQWHYQTLGVTMPFLPAAALKAGTFIFGGEALAGWALLVLLVAGWVLFEWRVKSENKAMIRLACAVFLNALVTVALVFTAIATIFGLTESASYTFHADPRPYAMSCLSDADGALQDLRRAADADDPEAIAQAENTFSAMLSNLRISRQSVALAAASRPGQVEAIQSLMHTMTEQSRLVDKRQRTEDVDALVETWRRFSELVELGSYDSDAPARGVE